MQHEHLPVHPSKAKLSIIISFRNEETIIPEAINRLSQVLNAEIAAGHLGDFEIIWVDDVSNDRSLSLLREIGGHDKRIKTLRMARNHGHDICAMAGLEFCTGDLAVYLDADLQDPPEMIPEMLKVWREKNTDVVHTVRTSREGESYLTLLVTRLGYFILRKFSKVGLEANCGDFKLISRKAINEIVKFRERNPFFRGIVTYVGFNQEKIFYARKPRFAGRSQYGVFSSRVINFFLESALISFSDAPLKLVAVTGFGVFLSSFVFIAYVLVERYLGNTVPGWSGIMILTSLLGGLQLMSMGILGLYLNSIFIEVKRRPQYLVDEKINL